MRFPHWLRPLAGRLSRVPTPRARRRLTFRPCLERLEDRTVPAAVATPAGLTNWWPADNSPADIAGQGAGVAVGGVGYAPGEVSQAFNFTGPGQYVAVTGNSTIQGPRTIEGWVKPDPNSGFGLPIITFGPEGVGDFFGIAGTTGNAAVGQYKLYVDHWGVAAYASTATVTPGVWNHVALTYDSGTVRFFINGQAAGEVEGNLYDYPLDSATIGGNTIGGTTTKSSFSGEIDELSLYNRTLSAQEIQSIYQAGSDGKSQVFIASSSPAEGETVVAPPTDFTLHLSQGFNSNLVQPTDLTVNGVAADSVTSIDPSTVSFHYAISPVTAVGPQTMQFESLGWSSTFNYTVAGRLDSTFGNGGVVTTEFNTSAYAQAGDETGAWDIAVQPNDGKIILAGDIGSAATGYEFVVARYNANGVLDTTFGQNGQVTLNFGSGQDHGYGVTIQPDGKILVAGPTYNSATGLHEFAVARLLPNGALDPGFSSADDNLGPGMVTVGFDAIDVSPTRLPLRAQLQGNQIVLSGMSTNYFFALARLNSDGSVDNSFGTDGNGRVAIPVGGIYGQADAVIEPSGKIVIADETGRVFRLNSDGSPDNTFSNQTLDFSAGTVIRDAQGNILISGRNDEETFTHQDWVVARLDADGNVDMTFGTGGEAQFSIDSTHEAAGALAVQANGKIIVTGATWKEPGDILRLAAARLTADGQLDTSFGSQGSVFLPLDDQGNVVVDSEGGILIPGTVYQPSSIYDFALVRLRVDNHPPVAAVAGPTGAVAGQALTFTLTATDADQDPIASFDIDWNGDGKPDQPINGPSGAPLTQTFATPGTYTFRVRAHDAYEAGDWVTQTVVVGDMSAPNLQDTLATGGTVTLQATTPSQASAIFAAANGLDPATTPTSTLVVDLGGQTVQDTVANVPPQVTLRIINGTFIGGSPALIVESGQVTVLNSTFSNATNAATILVTGGSLTLRGDVIQESTGYSQAAIAITGGMVDLGTVADLGGNTLNVSGTGEFVHNLTSNPVSALGNTFQINGTPQSASSLSFTTLTSSAATATFNQAVTFTATVRANDSSDTPTGSVDFLDTTTNTDLGSVALSGGVATLSTSGLGVGTHVLQATYSGDGTFLGGDSILTQVVNKATPIFSLVAPPTVIDGTYYTQITGAIAAGTLNPSGNVTVTVNGVSWNAAINPDGTFAVIVPTASLGTGSYTIDYSYAGDNNFISASATANMDVTDNVLALFNQSQAKNAGSTIPIQIELVSASGQDVSSAGTTVTALGIVATTDTVDTTGSIDPSQVGALQPVQAAGNSNPNNVFREQGGAKPYYMYNLQTPTGLTAGTYRLYFQVQGDPLWHWVTFSVS